jgi:macrolide phosphotransferase
VSVQRQTGNGAHAKVDNVNIRSPYVLAALISASQPRLSVSACRLRSYQPRGTQDKSLTAAVIEDSSRHVMDALVSSDAAGAAVLRKRYAAAQKVTATKQIAVYDFDVQAPVALGSTVGADGQSHTVLLTKHVSGQALDLARLGDLEASSLGAGLATIHRTDISYLLKKGQHGISGPAMRVELENWIHSLALQNVIPQSIISRWDQLVSIDGLWKFTTVLTHGDMKSGDALFEPHRGLSALMNWEDWKISDPARDFAWLYGSDVDEHERDLVLSGYGRVMGSLEDPRIVPRARLWKQMSIVRDFLSALDSADHDAIVTARAQVSKLASSLQPVIAVSPGNPARAGQEGEKTGTRLAHAAAPTVTVGTAKSNSSDQKRQDGQQDQGSLSSLLSSTTSTSTTKQSQSPTSAPSTASSSTITVGTLLHPSQKNEDIQKEFGAHPSQQQSTSRPSTDNEGETTSFDASGFAQGIGRPLAARVSIKDSGSVKAKKESDEGDFPTIESHTSA